MGLRVKEQAVSSILARRDINKPSCGYLTRLISAEEGTRQALVSLKFLCESAPKLGLTSIDQFQTFLYCVLECKRKISSGMEHPFTRRKRSGLERFVVKRPEFAESISDEVVHLLDEILNTRKQRCTSLVGLEEYLISLVPQQLLPRLNNQPQPTSQPNFR